ncbi:MAG: hypothetical protein K0S08_1081 [Gammaproteobacteria bacterium]|jgi:acyl-CoA hydrolase|nr:hypothetical protein [Gammaproteobacteria bacterium]
MTVFYTQHDLAAKKVIEQVGKTIILGVPLGIGKPVGFINAIYRLAEQDPSIQLTIFTGLTLARPSLHNELEKRFAEPLLKRLLGNYEDPFYEKPREQQKLPKNINVVEFFFAPGKYLHNAYAQQHYINSNYTNVVRDLGHYGINVLAQQVARSKHDPKKFSVSCNSDLFYDTLNALETARDQEGRKVAMVAEINEKLPFMFGEEAIVMADNFTDVIDTGSYPDLFAIPREALSTQDHLIGLYTSCLIKDNSSLQIGIGKLSNAVASALILRHKDNAAYQDMLKALQVEEKFGKTIEACGAYTPFTKGIYGSTEMLSDEYLQLYQNNILKKKVYDHIGLQRLLNTGVIEENFSSTILEALFTHHIISPTLNFEDVEFLKEYGIFKPEVEHIHDQLKLPSGETFSTDLLDESNRHKIATSCLDKQLSQGKIIHAGFFLGSKAFYQQLRNMDDEERAKFEMASIARTNLMYWNYELLRLQRQDARFVNSTMMVTLGGVAISDGLKNIQEVSGVGGQFDFISMSNHLANARSILTLHSTRKAGNKASSNIIWDYPNVTVPRYLRDIIVTEYGIADCLSKMDRDVVRAMLQVADSRFQAKLLAQAKQAGKISSDYLIPKLFQENRLEKSMPVVRELQSKGYCKAYPFGSDLTEEEQVLAKALMFLKNQTPWQMLKIIPQALCTRPAKKFAPYLARMDLLQPKNFKEFFYQKLVLLGLKQTL